MRWSAPNQNTTRRAAHSPLRRGFAAIAGGAIVVQRRADRLRRPRVRPGTGIARERKGKKDQGAWRRGRVGMEADGAILSIPWADGRKSPFPAIWLCDNRPETRAGPEGQRLTDALHLPDHPRLRGATILATGIDIAFSCFDRPSTFDATWLRRHALDAASRAERKEAPRLWDSGLARDLPAERYDRIVNDRRALARWLGQVRSFGFALLHGVPARPGMVCEVIGLFGYVRETNYGRLFDVI